MASVEFYSCSKIFERIGKSIVKKILPLHLLFFFFSLSGVLGKYASNQEFLSLGFILLYGAELVVLFAYSIFWQIVLRKFPLTTAYTNRSATTIWGLMWGVLLFGENLNVAKVIATALIVSGIVVIGAENE